MKPGIELVTMKKVVAAILAAALWIAGGANAADSLTMADFAHSIKLQVSGYTGTETLANFPVLVRISTSLGNFQYSDMRSTKGGDLAFFAADGTRLASEIDTWDTSGTSLVWVRLPSMAQGTKFYMCYGTVDENSWVENDNPWGDYVGVWHLSETGAKTTIADSTENGLDGNALASNGEGLTAGRIGRARRIAKSREHAYGIVVGATNGIPQKAVADSLGTDFSASFWMNPQATDVTYGFLIDRRKGEYNKPGGWGTRLHTKPQLEVYAADEKPYSGNYEGTASGSNYTALFTQNTWSKVDIRWYATDNAGAADIYVNGVLVETDGQEAEQTLVALVGDLEVGHNATLGAELDEIVESGGLFADRIGQLAHAPVVLVHDLGTLRGEQVGVLLYRFLHLFFRQNGSCNENGFVLFYHYCVCFFVC